MNVYLFLLQILRSFKNGLKQNNLTERIMTPMNPFETYAEKIIPAAVKAQMRGAAIRAEKAKNKKLADRDLLHDGWRKWHQEQMDELLRGEHAAPAQELATFLERMTMEDGDALLALIEQQQWHCADEDTCYHVLRMVSHTIVYLRGLAGLDPFDDPLPFDDNAEPSLFMLIREVVNDRAGARS
jgi:hypothetical protein